jgi:ABC-type transporter Mla subunit MlaD
MSGESSYFKLGLFVIVGVLLIVAGVVVFGGAALFTDYVTIETATPKSVEGLGVGAAVKYSGVPVGKVSKIEMASWRHRDPDPAKRTDIARYIIVQMQIRRDVVRDKGDDEIKRTLERVVQQGMRVRMASSGLTGPAFMELVFLDPNAYPPEPLPWQPDDLYMPSAPSTMTEIVSSVEEIVGELKRADLKQTAADAQKLINDVDKVVNEVQMPQIRDRVIAAIDELRASNKRLKDILDSPSVSQTVDDLPKISGNARDLTAQVKELLRDERVQSIIDDMKATLTNASAASVELRRALRKVDSLLSTQTQDLESIVVNLRRVMEGGAALVEDAKSNPSRALFGEPPPRFQPGTHK